MQSAAAQHPLPTLPLHCSVSAPAPRTCWHDNEPEHLLCSARCLPYYLENEKNKVWHWSVIHFESGGHDWWISWIWSGMKQHTNSSIVCRSQPAAVWTSYYSTFAFFIPWPSLCRKCFYDGLPNLGFATANPSIINCQPDPTTEPQRDTSRHNILGCLEHIIIVWSTWW